MRAANGMGTVSKLSGKRRKPWLLRDNKRFNEETGKFERLALGVFETKKEAEIYRIAYFTNNLDMLKKTDIKVIDATCPFVTKPQPSLPMCPSIAFSVTSAQ